MKRFFVLISVSVLLCASCAKSAQDGLNDSALRYFRSWMEINHPDAVSSGRGVYILENVAGKEAMGSVDSYPYILLDYTCRDLKGNIVDYTEAGTAQILGEYEDIYTYTPQPYYRGEGGLPAGLEDAIAGMDVGGERTVIIPGWLDSATQYDTEEEYIQNVSGDDAIYQIKLVEQIEDITKWEADSLDAYVARHYGLSPSDTLAYGFYLLKTAGPEEPRDMPTDTTLNINYTGRLLNGKVFDTTIRDTALVHGIYSSSNDYDTSSVAMAEDYTDITLDSSSIIEGFSYTLSKMHPGETVLGMFISQYGYSYTGSGKTIPPLSPLIFEIQIVE